MQRLLIASIVGIANVLLVAFPAVIAVYVLGATVPTSTWLLLALVFAAAFVEVVVSRHASNEWAVRPSTAERLQQRLAAWSCLAIVVTQWLMIVQSVSSTNTATTFFVAVGVTITVLGIAIRSLSIVALRRDFTNVVQVRSQQQLQTQGIFRWLRHPSECGLLLLLVGMTCVAQSQFAAICICFVVLPLMIARIHVEERELARAFDDRYSAYASRSWRLLPLVY